MSVTGRILSVVLMHLVVSFQVSWVGPCVNCLPGNCTLSVGQGIPYLVGSI